VAVLIGLGITEFSVTPVSIAKVKDNPAGLEAARARALAEKALDCADAAEVERMFRARF